MNIGIELESGGCSSTLRPMLDTPMQIIVLSTELEIPPQSIIAAMRDRASDNVAMRTIKIVYNQLLDVNYTLDLIGERMNTPTLHHFCKAWIGLFSRNLKSGLLWRTQTGLPSPSYSVTWR